MKNDLNKATPMIVTQIIIIPRLYKKINEMQLSVLQSEVIDMVGELNIVPDNMAKNHPVIIVDYELDDCKKSRISKHVLTNDCACIYVSTELSNITTVKHEPIENG